MKNLYTSLVLTFLLFIPNQVMAQWELRYPRMLTSGITDMVFLDQQNGFAVTSAGNILKTTDGGEFWSITKNYQREYFSELKFLDQLNGFVVSPPSYMNNDKDFFYTTDGGSTWSSTYLGTSDAVTILPLSTSSIIKSTNEGTIEILDNFWGQWSQRYIMPFYFGDDYYAPYGNIKDFYKFNSGRILALGSSFAAFYYSSISDSVAFILFSDNNGLSWDTLWCDLPKILNTFTFSGNYGWMGGRENEIYKSTDGGTSWTLCYSENQITDKTISKIFAVDSLYVYAVSDIGEILSTTDGGNSWDVHLLSPSSYYGTFFNVYFLTRENGFAFGPDLWTTTDAGLTWNKVDDSIKPNFRKIQFINTELGYAIGGEEYYGGQSFYKTTDGGYSWAKIFQRNTGGSFNGFFMQDSIRGWLTDHNRLLKTIDGGYEWSEVPVDTSLEFIRGVEFFDDSLGILFEVSQRFNDYTLNYVTTDKGNTWGKYQMGDQPYLSSFTKIKRTDPGHIWVANQQGLWLSRDTSKTWGFVSNEISVIDAGFDFLDSLNGWVAHLDGRQDKVKYTTDGGITWTTLDKPYMNQTTDLVIEGRDYFGRLNVTLAGLYGSIFGYEEGFPNGRIQNSYTDNWLFSIAVFKEGNTAHRWISGMGGIILYRNIYITDVKNEEGPSPIDFVLDQNYPNPFNNTTVIRYSLPKEGLVTLKIYNIIVEEVAVLVNDTKQAGNYQITFNSDNLPSGVYFYRLQAGDFVQTRKMILLK